MSQDILARCRTGAPIPGGALFKSLFQATIEGFLWRRFFIAHQGVFRLNEHILKWTHGIRMTSQKRTGFILKFYINKIQNLFSGMSGWL